MRPPRAEAVRCHGRVQRPAVSVDGKRNAPSRPPSTHRPGPQGTPARRRLEDTLALCCLHEDHMKSEGHRRSCSRPTPVALPFVHQTPPTPARVERATQAEAQPRPPPHPDDRSPAPRPAEGGPDPRDPRRPQPPGPRRRRPRTGTPAARPQGPAATTPSWPVANATNPISRDQQTPLARQRPAAAPEVSHRRHPESDQPPRADHEHDHRTKAHGRREREGSTGTS